MTDCTECKDFSHCYKAKDGVRCENYRESSGAGKFAIVIMVALGIMFVVKSILGL